MRIAIRVVCALLFTVVFAGQLDAQNIVFVSRPNYPDPATGLSRDQPFIDDLMAAGYTVTTFYNTALENASQATLDTLNNADLVIIGRSGNSGDFGTTHVAAWDAVKAPVLLLHLWAARTNRMRWLPTGTTTQHNVAGEVLDAIIEKPDDPVFAGAPIVDGKMPWVSSAYDFMATKDGGNGTVLARSAVDSNVIYVRWEPWVEYFNGAGNWPASHRTLIGNGNDAFNSIVNYLNFTPEAYDVYLKEVARMVQLPKNVPPPGNIVFVSRPNYTDPATGLHRDQPFIDDLEAAGYTITTFYNTALENASQATLDTLNNADLVIIGRSGNSGDFGTTHVAAWNAVKTPILLLHLWAARSNRLNWLPTGTTTQHNVAGEVLDAIIETPTDPVFAGAPIVDGKLPWVNSAYDFMATRDGGNGTVLARAATDSNVLYVRWNPWVEFYDSSGTQPAGYRTLLGNGNDAFNSIVNYLNFTPEAYDVYLKEVARMLTLPAPPPGPTVSVEEPRNQPASYDLAQNYPNPFNPSTNIRFSLAMPGKVSISVYNALGQRIATLLDGQLPSGTHEVTFNATALATGVYFYRIEAADFTRVRKMLLVK